MFKPMPAALPALFAISFLLTGCVTSSYEGEYAPPTETVEVFRDEKSVPPGYTVMGTIHTTAPPGTALSSIETELVDQARMRGADAIVIDNEQLDVVGYQEGTPTHADAIRDKVIVARLLKQKK